MAGVYQQRSLVYNKNWTFSKRIAFLSSSLCFTWWSVNLVFLKSRIPRYWV
jgi:hypothetical protein